MFVVAPQEINLLAVGFGDVIGIRGKQILDIVVIDDDLSVIGDIREGIAHDIENRADFIEVGVIDFAAKEAVDCADRKFGAVGNLLIGQTGFFLQSKKELLMFGFHGGLLHFDDCRYFYYTISNMKCQLFLTHFSKYVERRKKRASKDWGEWQ